MKDADVIDLHIHTHASQDGQYGPREVFELARRHGLRAIAFADHDSVDSVPEGTRLSVEFGIEFIPAVELTTAGKGHELHLLAYYIDPEDDELHAFLDRIAQAGIRRNRLRCERLRELGFVLDFERVSELSQGKPPTGYPIFLAIAENPANHNFPAAQPYLRGERSESPVYDFCQDYFNKGRPAYVEPETVDTHFAIRQVRRWRAVPVLAHPGRTPISLVDGLIDAGLLGLEIYNPSHTPEQTECCLKLARRRNLLVTAGSDFHGPAIKPDIKLAEMPHAGYDLYEELKSLNSKLKSQKETV